MAPHADIDTGRAENGSSNGHGNGNGSTASPRRPSPPSFTVDSPDVTYTPTHINSRYVYRTTKVSSTTDSDGGERLMATPHETTYEFRTERRVPRTGVMLVGWGGNNGSTVTAGLLANKRNLSWETRTRTQQANYYGSIVMGSTMKLGVDNHDSSDVHIPFHSVLPLVHPSDLVLGGWDVSSLDLAASMDRAGVLEPTLKSLVRDEMRSMVPLPSIYYPDFIAANQEGRADNLIPGSRPCTAHVDRIRQDIRSFKSAHALDSVVVVWTANTERFADVVPGVNDTADNLLRSIDQGHPEISPSTIFAVACSLEGNTPYINGSPQNTFVPGALELAAKTKSFVGGDDFKSGQTKMKSALVDFLIGAGIKLTSIASYNHLGNNDGRNLSEQKQFRSKEISKSNVVDDLVEANQVLYPGVNKKKTAAANKGKGGGGGGGHKEDDEGRPDHAVVIKYMPAVGDSKRALDEYYAEIFLGGHQTISIFNVCEDSLLASPLIIDLVLVAEIMTRIQWREIPSSSSGGQQQETAGEFKPFDSVLSILSYMLKAPLVPKGAPVVNALAKQRAALTNIFRACVGLQPESDMGLEHKLF